MLNEPTTPEAKAAVARKSATMKGMQLRSGADNKRTLKLEGETLAGCKVLRRAANATHATRFLSTMACGHDEIIDGTELKQAEKLGKTLVCSGCRAKGKRKGARL